MLSKLFYQTVPNAATVLALALSAYLVCNNAITWLKDFLP
jgi:hypothetical protein